MEAKRIISPRTAIEGISDLMATDLQIQKIASSKHGYSEFGLDNFNKSVKHLLNYMFVNPINRPIEIDETSGSPLVLMNSKYKDQFLENVVLIDLPSLFPNVMVNLNQNGSLHFNYKEFGVLYHMLVQARIEVKRNIQNWDEYCGVKGGITHRPDIITNLIKILINFTYGACKSSKSVIRANDIGMVTDHIRSVFSRIMHKHDNVVYIDTDQVWILGDHNLDLIMMMLNYLNVPYEMDECRYEFKIRYPKRYWACRDGVEIVKDLYPLERSKNK